MIRQEIMGEYTNHDDRATAQLELPGDRTMVEESMSGAESLVHTLAGSGVDTCFTNPVRAKCISSLRSTGSLAYAVCLPSSRVSRPGQRTAMRGSLESRRQHCSIVGQVSLTVLLICTTRNVRAYRW